MVKDEQSNQLNLTVVALVALVAIVGLVALVMNSATVAKIATGPSDTASTEQVAGQATADDYQIEDIQVQYIKS